MDKSFKNPAAGLQKGTVAILCIVCLLLFAALGCRNNIEDSGVIDIDHFVCASCEDKEILKILNNEPAIVRKSCFDHVGRVDTFFFQLANHYPEFYASIGVFPAGEIPQQCRQEDLSVYISGNVTSCIVGGGCSQPNIKIGYIHLFELTSIKINK